MAHIFYHDSCAWLLLVISNLDDKGIDAFILALHDGLCEDDSMVGMTCTVGDPILLTLCGWAINNEFIIRFIECSSGLHFWCIITITKFCEAEAAYMLKGVDLIHEWEMSFSV